MSAANQCDGCHQGLPIADGIHCRDGHPWIRCTATQYGVAERPAEPDWAAKMREPLTDEEARDLVVVIHAAHLRDDPYAYVRGAESIIRRRVAGLLGEDEFPRMDALPPSQVGEPREPPVPHWLKAAYEDERRKFQQETRRTSAQSVLLRRLCDLAGEAVELLDTPLSLTDAAHLSATDAAYGAIEARGKECGATDEQIGLAQVLFADGFKAALGAVRAGAPPTLIRRGATPN